MAGPLCPYAHVASGLPTRTQRVCSREVCMQTQAHPLESFFHHEVRNIYEGKLGLNDPDVTGYIARMLCQFAEADSLFLARGSGGHASEELKALMLAADPVHGTAPSFDAERAMRKYIGDYALFVAGMVPAGI